MTPILRRSCLLSVLLAATSLSAQQDRARAAALEADFHVPVHTMPGDPIGGAYGTWAMGPGYKVSFHDGFTFYPFLGSDAPRLMPWRWRTTSITAGGRSLIDPAVEPTSWFRGYRFEYRRDGVVEAYDVRRDGVEQSFVLARRPDQPGAIVVTGRVESELRSAPADLAHRSLRFVDTNGRPVVEYGAATAIDAGGRRFPMQTSFDGQTITLHLGAEAVAQAVFPLILDPLTTATTIHTAPGSIVHTDCFARYGLSHPRRLLIAHSRQFARSDVDCYAHMTTEWFGNPVLVYTDITTSWSSDRPSAGHSLKTSSWLVATERTFPNQRSAIRLYRHDGTSVQLNSGRLSYLWLPLGQTHRRPSLGSNNGGGYGLVAYQVDVTNNNSNTATTTVKGVVFDASRDRFLAAFPVYPATAPAAADMENPSVTRRADSFWTVAYQQRDSASSPWQIKLTQVDNGTGQRLGHSVLNSGAGPLTTPFIDGREDRLMLVCNQNFITTRVNAYRLRWPRGGSKQLIASRTVAQSFSSSAPVAVRGLAARTGATTHWCVAYTEGSFKLHIDRLGHQAYVVERSSANSIAPYVSPSVTYSADQREFLAVTGVNSATPAISGRSLSFHPDAANTIYGTGCGNATIWGSRPDLGDEFFRVGLGGAPWLKPAILYMSAAPAAIPFPTFPGCFFNYDPNQLIATFSGTVPLYGNMYQTIALPGNLPQAELYFQWWYEGGTGWRMTQGLEARVR